VGSFLFWVIFSLICGVIGALLTVYGAPMAAGSGIPELIAMLNGVNIPELVSYRCLFVKSIGVVMAISATLCIGKEGPLAHIGAMVAILTVYLPFNWMKQF
jgi:chloride channel 7